MNMNWNPNSAPGPPPVLRQDDDQTDLRDYMQVIWRRMWVIILCFLVVLGTTVTQTLRMKPIYQASSVLEVQKSRADALSLREVFSQGLGMEVEKELQTEVEILKSRTVAIDAARLTRHQLLLDKSKPLYDKYFKLYKSRLDTLTGAGEKKDKKKTYVQSAKRHAPLRMEALEIPPPQANLYL